MSSLIDKALKIEEKRNAKNFSQILTIFCS